jgi:hypothetical protein
LLRLFGINPEKAMIAVSDLLMRQKNGMSGHVDVHLPARSMGI